MDRESEEKKMKLERELRFLKESLDSDIITKHEYDRSKERIDQKIKALEISAQMWETKEEHTPKKEDAVKLEVIDYPPTQELKEAVREKDPVQQFEKKDAEKKVDEIMDSESKTEDKIDEAEEKEEIIGVEKIDRGSAKQSSGKGWIWISVIVVMIILGFYLYNQSYRSEGKGESVQEAKANELKCISNIDCHMDGMAGICNNPGTEYANCTFTPILKVNMTVLNEKSCKSCDITPTVKIISDLFPGVDYRLVDISSQEGKNLIEKLKIEVLPAFIFDSKITESYNFGKASRIFTKIGDDYVVNTRSSGAGYYFKRSKVPNTILLFGIKNATNTIKAEANMKEVVGLFGKGIVFEEHLIEQGSKDKLSQELDINTYPTWLINNQYKFNGIFPPETMKQKFCDWNDLKECSKTLSLDLK